MGDDNVLCVKFSEAESDKKLSLNDYWELYKNIAKDGITVGLRRYHFFGKFLCYLITPAMMNSEQQLSLNQHVET